MLEEINLNLFEKRKRAKFINSLSGFKSSNLIGTKAPNGAENLSIISSAFHLGADPAILGFVIRPDTVVRDTLNNLRENHYCTLNHVNQAIVKQAHQCSARYKSDESEFEKTGLHSEYLANFYAPFVKESKIKLALKMLEEIKVSYNGTHIIVCEIEHVYLNSEWVSEDGHVDLEKAMSVTASGLDCYHTTEKLFRLSYAKPDKDVEEL